MKRSGIASLIIVLTLVATNSFFVNGNGADDIADIPSRSEPLKRDMDLSEASMASFMGYMNGVVFSKSISSVGDINGDGYGDFLIGFSTNDAGGHESGITYLVLGSGSGWKMRMNLSTLGVSFVGEAQDDRSGCSVSGAGDVNSDGYDDLLIGAIGNDDGNMGGGKAYLLFGKPSGWSGTLNLSKADASFIGTDPHGWAGRSVSGVGDVNGDGYDDFLIGCDGYAGGAGEDRGKVYLVFGKAAGWSRNCYLDTIANASFLGEGNYNYCGFCVSGAGDVNGDGLDDFLIGAEGNDDGGEYAGKTYLVFGKKTGWELNTDIATTDVSFIGENSNDQSGYSVSGAGDVNGDGFDDFLIGAFENDEAGGNTGQTYLIFGKRTGWSQNFDLSNADASFHGEIRGDLSGCTVSGIGNVNGDGFDDILIGATGNDESNHSAGQSYIIFGKASGWSMDVNLSDADASFQGENRDDGSGHSVSGAGDVNGDGFDDILIKAVDNSQGEFGEFQTYLIPGRGFREPYSIQNIHIKDAFGGLVRKADIGEDVIVEILGTDSDPTVRNRARVNLTFSSLEPRFRTISLVETEESSGIYTGEFKVPIRARYFETIKFSTFIDPGIFSVLTVDYPNRPSSVVSLGIYSDMAGSHPIDKLDIGETAFFRCTGLDTDLTTVDLAFVNLTSDRNSSYHPMVILTETGPSTGTYTALFTVQNTMHYFENITLTSDETKTIKTRFMVQGPVKLVSDGQYIIAVEDSEYFVKFFNIGYNIVIWSFSTSAYWLTWDEDEKVVHGIPRNNDVGKNEWSVLLQLEDDHGHKSVIEYELEVVNVPPRILTAPVNECFEGVEYSLDLNSDDDGQGQITWSLITNSSFLTIDKVTGLLKGFPFKEEVGTYSVQVIVDDGNQGTDKVKFNLTVKKRNDRPGIMTKDITQVEQDTLYWRDYEVFDADEGDTHTWTLRTDADWLSMENETGVLYGTPDGYDVGDWVVNITVIDSGGLNDSREFILTVLNINDRPRFDDVPADIEVLHGTRYHFDVNASDPDYGSVQTYSLVTRPVSDMRIDPNTGAIAWTASYRSMPPNGSGMEVTLKVSDGILSSTHSFHIVVLPTGSPSVELRSPSNGARTLSTLTKLEWVGSDPEDEPLTYTLYIGESESVVASLRTENIERSDLREVEYNVTQLIEGKTYYWTVIPDDGCTAGSCTSGVLSFRINNRPILRQVKDLEAVTGEKFRLELDGSDADEEDKLRFFLIGGPDGMDIDAEKGMISFVPTSDQIGIHKVTVHMSDGYETVEISFNIEVSKGSSSKLGLFVGAGTGVLLLLLMLLLIYVFVIRKKTTDEEEGSKKVLEDMELHQREKEWEEAHMRPTEQQTVTSVPLSAAEAHAHDHDPKLKGYEDIYGQPAPDKSEELTTEELKDELEKLTEEMKKVEIEKNDNNN